MHTTTFRDRLLAAMDGMPRGSQARLAAACGIKPPSVNAWLSGETKSIGADLLFPAARFLNVSPEWLATGRGPMREHTTNGLPLSHSVGIDPDTLAKAFSFTRTFMAARGMAGSVDAHPHLVGTAYDIISRMEAADDSAGLVEVLGRMSATWEVEDGKPDGRGD